ncbi:hypothetical protein [Actinoplanes sp. NPDC026619]|uniref:hypothetical protein n=1 Tax=Actinoplanes sp. NPDC026619 TaxID=3155798 RepID=UPI00340E8DF5
MADARDALAFAGASVVLLDHFAADEINAGVAAVSDFAASFDGEQADAELASLRAVFERKAPVT